jgi:hypothetical protein
MASRNGEVKSQQSQVWRKKADFSFNTEPSEDIYPVESPEIVIPVGKKSYTILQYKHSQQSAAVAYNGTYRCITMGFPMETIKDAKQRAQLMESTLKFLSNK